MAIRRPAYSLPEQIKTGLYTTGKEYMFVDLREYIGPYHVYPNGAVYTEANYSDRSVPLIPYVSSQENKKVLGEDRNVENNSIYFKLTGKKFNKYVEPQYYYPTVTEDDKEQGFIERYFVQRINNLNEITEISRQQFQSVNTNNTVGIDGGIYNKLRLQWIIAGDVVKENQIKLQRAELTMPGISNYLTDLDEFSIVV